MKKPRQLLTARHYLMDVSILPLLPEVNEKLPPGFLLVSASLDKALSSQSTPDLARLLDEASGGLDEGEATELGFRVTHDTLPRILNAYRNLKERAVVEVISDERPDTPELRRALKDIAKSGGMQFVRLTDGSKLTTDRLLVRHIVTMLSYSQRTGTVILSRGRSLINRITKAVAALELPQKADALIERKQAFTKRLVAKPGRKFGKFFAGALIAVGGVFNPAVGAAGALFYFVDP